MASAQTNLALAPAAEATPASRRIAEFAVAADAARMPGPVLAKAGGCLTDFLGCALEARDLPWGRQVIRYAGIGPEGPATVIGTDLTVAATEAALANGTLGHGLIREDMHVASCTHMGVVVWPALLAVAELRPVSGADFVAAAVVGYEVGARVGRALFDADLAARLRPTGTVGAIGAAAAAARLLRLGVEQTMSAVGLAANTACGLNEWPWAGGNEIFFHAGVAARNAVTAVLLAEGGVFASPTAIDGRAGLFAAYGRRERAGRIEPLGDGAYEIMSVYWKPAPACNYVQTPCQAALDLVRQGVRAQDIREIRIASFRSALDYPGCNQPGPFPGVLEAKMSIQYSVAATLVRGAVEEANYAELDHGEVRRLAAATELTVDPEFEAAYPDRQGVAITVVLADGSERTARLQDVAPVDLAGVRQRFEAIAASRLGSERAAAILAAIDGLPDGGDPRRIARLTAQG
ncbi:MAG TPA: MmgE/PrpD family protein [Microvirga sp.]|nr:MmgE/PrpD family protein [Microvirga sp.]